jgi:3-carboxy-cis,cis-muconate cycloisomerase
MRLIDTLATTEAMSETFSDKSVLQAMLQFEAALARAEAKVGIIPQDAAQAIAASARTESFDVSTLAHAANRAGTPGIPIAKALTERVRANNAEAARFVHWGATSQDVADTALVLLLKKARSILMTDLARAETALEKLSNQHRDAVMLGRTLMQAAPPVTFGLKAAGWLGAMRRSRSKLESCFRDAIVLQFGGATGTLAALGENGIAVGRALAKELDLGYPDAPWHTHRDRLARLVCECGVLTGSLGKMARDVSFLMQGEVAEASEPGGDGRGGSSTMPHKRNPIACALTLVAANRVPGLVAAFLSGMMQEHERAVGGWQAEWATVSEIVQATGLAAASMVEVAEGLTIDQARMQHNIEATRGAIFAERAMILLGAAMGRDVAHRIVEEATRSVAQGRHLAEVLAENPEVARHLNKGVLARLEKPGEYLGMAEEFRKRLLSSNARDSD